MNITLRQLEIFFSVATYGHVGKAAAALNISQSAVSMGLSDFENTVGERLFDRVSRKVFLNDAGRTLLPKAMGVLEAAGEIEAFRADGKLTGRIRAGASTTIGNYLLPSILGDFMNVNRSIEVTLEVGNTAYVVDKLLKHELDLAFVEGPVSSREIVERFWRLDGLVIFTSPFYEIKGGLENAEWLIREKGSGTRDVFESAMAAAGYPVKIKMELGHTEAIKKAVEAGLGVGCLSMLTIKREAEMGLLKILNHDRVDLSRKLNIILHKDKYITGGLKAFIDFCI